MGRQDGPTRRPGRQRPHGRLAARADRDGQPSAGHAPGRHRLRPRVPHPRGARVAVGWFGEGASARGDTHESMTFAGTRTLPMVFVCDNNQWAYSTPTHLEFATEHVADRAQAYGFEGVVVDGTDVLAVYREAKRAIDKARAGGGPTLHRVPHPPDGGSCRPRRRVLRPEADVRAVGRVRPDRALPHLATRQRRPERRGGGRDRGGRQEAPERVAAARGGVAAARYRRPDEGRLRLARGSRHAAPQVRWPRADLSAGDLATGSARRCAATSACS